MSKTKEMTTIQRLKKLEQHLGLLLVDDGDDYEYYENREDGMLSNMRRDINKVLKKLNIGHYARRRRGYWNRWFH